MAARSQAHQEDHLATPELSSGVSIGGSLSGSVSAQFAGRPVGAQYLRRRLLVASDALALILAFAGALGAIALSDRGGESEATTLSLALMIPAWNFIAYLAGLYHQEDRRIDLGLIDELGRVLVMVTAWIWLLTITRSLAESGATDLLLPGLIWLLAIPAILGFRVLTRVFTRSRRWNRQPVVVVGDESHVNALARRIARHPEWGLEVESLVLPEDGPGYQLWEHKSGVPAGSVGTKCLGAVESERGLAQLVGDASAERVMIAGGPKSMRTQARLVHELIDAGMAVDQVAGGPETHYSNAVFQELEGTPVVSVAPAKQRPFDMKLKRAFDVAVSLASLVALSPVFAWVALRIKLDSKGPIFYRQERCGLDGVPFYLFKFRTMVDGAHDQREALREQTRDSGNDNVLFKLADDPRITAFGARIRRSSLDELPQLWNVLRGDMSMVGPRPLVMEEAREAKDLFWARTRVKPGIAGPWQALGRSSIPFEDMIRLDYSYVVSWSMGSDVKLLMRTTDAVFRGRGAC